MAKNKLLNKIWSWYALFYDWALCYSPAYIELVNQVVRSIVTHLNNKLVTSPSILDIGCGTGNICQAICLQVVGAKITGVDFSKAMLNQAKIKCPNCEWFHADIYQFLQQAPSNTYDIIVMNNSFYPLANKDKIIHEINRICQSNGLFVLSDPDRTTADLSFFLNYHLKHSTFRQLLMLPFLLLSGLFAGYFVHHANYSLSNAQEAKDLVTINNFSLLEHQPTYGGLNFYLTCIKSFQSW